MIIIFRYVKSFDVLVDIVDVIGYVIFGKNFACSAEDARYPALLDVYKCRYAGSRNLCLDRMLDILQVDDFTSDNKGIGFSCFTGTGCTADSVDIILVVRG